MLTIVYGDAENSIYNTSVYFKNSYESEWFDSELAKELVKIFNSSTCGDNCAKWILEIGKRQDITINLRHMMDFGMNTRFDIVIKNGGEVVHSMKELIPVANQYLNAMRQEQD